MLRRASLLNSHFLLNFRSSFPHQYRKLSMASFPSSPWPCSRCTFLNPPLQQASCQVCFLPFSPLSSASSSSPPNWSCKACTFINSSDRPSCEICGTNSNFNHTKESSRGKKRDLEAAILGDDIRKREKSARREIVPVPVGGLSSFFSFCLSFSLLHLEGKLLGFLITTNEI